MFYVVVKKQMLPFSKEYTGKAQAGREGRVRDYVPAGLWIGGVGKIQRRADRADAVKGTFFANRQEGLAR